MNLKAFDRIPMRRVGEKVQGKCPWCSFVTDIHLGSLQVVMSVRQHMHQRHDLSRLKESDGRAGGGVRQSDLAAPE